MFYLILFFIFLFTACSTTNTNPVKTAYNYNFEQNYLISGKQIYANGDYWTAILYFKNALKINPNNAVAYAFLAGCYYKLKRYEEAIPVFNKAIRFGYENVMVYVGLGFSYYYTGDKINSRIYFEKAINTLTNVKEKQKWTDFMNKHLQ